MQRRPSPLTRRKKLVFGIVSVAISATFTFAAAELLVRLQGIEPWIVEDIPLHVTPGGRLYTTHPLLGYAHRPGAFTVSLPNGYAFTVTHLANTLRVTRPLTTYANARPQPEIWIFGGSFTHGWALQDQETYPWLLQERWPAAEVVNYGVGGYGEVIFVGTTDPNINRLSPTPPKKGLHGGSYGLLTLKIPLLGSVEC